MDHERCSELLRRYVAGELPPGEAEDVRAHLAGCEGCRAEERAVSALGVNAVVPMDDLERARLHRGLAQELFTPRANADVTGVAQAAPRWTRWVAPALAGAAVLAGVFAMTMGGGTDEAATFGADDSAEGGEALEDSAGIDSGTDSGGGSGKAGRGGRVPSGAAPAAGEESLFLAQGAAPRFDAELGTTTADDLASIGRSGNAFRSLGGGNTFRSLGGDYDSAERAELYDRLLRDLIEQAGDAGAEVGDCAATLPQDGSILPAYGALATYDGRDVLVLGFGTNDPGSDELDRYLLWVWERGSCEQPVDTLFGLIERR